MTATTTIKEVSLLRKHEKRINNLVLKLIDTHEDLKKFSDAYRDDGGNDLNTVLSIEDVDIDIRNALTRLNKLVSKQHTIPDEVSDIVAEYFENNA